MQSNGACDVLVHRLPDGTQELFMHESMVCYRMGYGGHDTTERCGPQELKQTHRLVADRTVLSISFDWAKLPATVIAVKHGIDCHIFTRSEALKTIGYESIVA